MINLNKEVFNKLSEIKDLGICKMINYCYPETFSKLPCITFYEVNNLPKFSDDEEYLCEINYVIDIWANEYAQVNNIAMIVCQKLNEIGFVREVSYDIPTENIKHKFIRFKIIK